MPHAQYCKSCATPYKHYGKPHRFITGKKRIERKKEIIAKILKFFEQKDTGYSIVEISLAVKEDYYIIARYMIKLDIEGKFTKIGKYYYRL